MSAADDAFAAAEAAIEQVRAEGGTKLDLSGKEFAALTRLPDSIANLARLQHLDLDNTQVTDLTPLGGLAGLQTIWLRNTRVTDLTPLGGLARLQDLYLDKTQVTDLTPLGGLAGLQSLDLRNTQITDLTPLGGLAGLQDLFLDNTQVADLTPLGRLKELRHLYLNNTQLRDVTPLGGLAGLQILDLHNTQVTDLTPLGGLAELRTLILSNTQVTDLTPLGGLAGLQDLFLDNTQVADLTPLGGLAGLRRLGLDQSRVADLRPVAGLEALFQPEGPLYSGLHFADTPAARATPELTRLSEIGDDAERNRETRAYLLSLPPWPEPLPWEVDEGAPKGPVPEAPQPPPLPVLTLTEDHRIDLRPLGVPETLDPAVLARLYDRLRQAIGRLSRFANRYPGLAPVVESMNRSLGNDLGTLDFLNLHLDLGELFDLRGGEPTGDDPWESDARAAADAVLRTGPGLTLPHPEVMRHEESLSTFQRRVTAPEVVSEQRLAKAVSDDPRLATEPARALGRRMAVPAETGRTAEMRQAFVRKIILLASTIGEGLAGAVEGAVYGAALNVMLPAAEFLWLHKNEVMAVAHGWNAQAALWAEYILRAARDVIERAKNNRD